MGRAKPTGAAVVDIVGFGTVDGGGKLSTLTIAGIGVGLYDRVGGLAGGVDVELDRGCGGYVV